MQWSKVIWRVLHNNTTECTISLKQASRHFCNVLYMCKHTYVHVDNDNDNDNNDDEKMHMCQMLSDVQRETLFSCRPLLSFCCGWLVGFTPVQDDIIVLAEGKKKRKKNTLETYCMKSTLHAYPINRDITVAFRKDQDQVWHILQSSYSGLGFFSLWPCVLQCQISEHVTNVLFIRLQKLNTAMPPCHPSPAVERGRAWNGKAKARKTQVAGKDDSDLCGKKCVFFSDLQQGTRHIPIVCVALLRAGLIHYSLECWCFLTVGMFLFAFTPLWPSLCIYGCVSAYKIKPFWINSHHPPLKWWRVERMMAAKMVLSVSMDVYFSHNIHVKTMKVKLFTCKKPYWKSKNIWPKSIIWIVTCVLLLTDLDLSLCRQAYIVLYTQHSA